MGPGTAQEATIARLVAGKERAPGGGCGFLSLVHVVDFAAAIADALEHAPGAGVETEARRLARARLGYVELPEMGLPSCKPSPLSV